MRVVHRAHVTRELASRVGAHHDDDFGDAAIEEASDGVVEERLAIDGCEQLLPTEALGGARRGDDGDGAEGVRHRAAIVGRAR